MMLKRAILIVLFPFIVFADPSDTLGKSSCEFALDAHSRRESNQNWIFSPFSASACLSMVFTGAAGPTAEELSRALHLDGILEVPQTYRDLQNSLIHSTSKANDFTLHIAQGMWKADGFPFLSSYVSSMQNDFGAQIETIDFDSNATHRINSWFAEETPSENSKPAATIGYRSEYKTSTRPMQSIFATLGFSLFLPIAPRRSPFIYTPKLQK